jgi:hypothetical protein
MADHLSDPNDYLASRRAFLPRDLHHFVSQAVSDVETDSFILTESNQPLIWLSAARLAMLRRASSTGRVPVLVSPDSAELTEAMLQALNFHGGGWAVRADDGELRSGITGHRLASSVQSARHQDPVEDPNDISLAHLKPTNATHALLTVAVTIRHPPGPVPLPAEPAELLLSSLTGTTPTSFGRAEPANRAWDAAEMGWLCDRDWERGLSRSSFMAVGDSKTPASLQLRIDRHNDGTTEHLSAVINLGQLGEVELTRRLCRIDAAVALLARTCDTTFALISAQPGNAALTRPAGLPNAPVPLAILLGRGLVSGLKINTRQIADRFRAWHTSRDSALVVPLDSAVRQGATLRELLQAVDFDRATPDMGLSPSQIRATRQVARY